MIKILIATLFTFFFVIEWQAIAQRYFVTNLYPYELFLMNPSAAALKKDCYSISGYYQKQWFGVNEAPTTQILSYEKGFKNNVGIGGYIYNDRNGLNGDFGLQQSFAYSIQLAKSSRYFSELLFGISALVNHRSIDMSIVGGSSLDPLLSGETSGYGYNANAGVLLTVNDFQFGVSATNLLPIKNNLYNDQREPRSFTDFNIHTSYLLHIPGRELEVEPFLFYRRNNYLDSRVDFNLNFNIGTSNVDFLIWGLVGYRYNAASFQTTSHGVAFTAGMIYQKFKLGLEYQFGLTNSRQAYGDSYQLVIGYPICRQKRKGAIPCPEIKSKR